MGRHAGIALLLTVLLMGGTAALGMDLPTARWWNSPALAQKLNLTEVEKRALEEKFVEARRRMIQIKGDMEARRFELETSLERDPFNEADVMELFGRLEDQRSRLAREGFRFILETRNLLGVERFRELRVMHDQARVGRGPKPEGRDLKRSPGPRP